ncbi:MAG: N-6 DNA methylase, partial [Alphaproteobacteria bacterium]|nr:N-6 DNA methylase [Alphaproteobacteria bacterium]
QLKGGRATEHSHRPALKTLLEAAVPDALATNEPRQIDCGAPDFVLTRKSGIPLGYVEAKNIGKDLDDKTYRAQFKRYAGALDNLIITDYLEFRLFLDGKHVETARIGDLHGKVVKARPDGAGELENLFRFFAGHTGIAVTGADALAEHMAAKARMLAQTIAKALDQDEALPETSEKLRGALHGQLAAFREHLIHDIKPAEFADIYAQTIAYGMFAARLHDETPGEFTREKAARLIPAANPFLRKFFQQIAAFDLDERIRWVVDALADLFRVSAVEELMTEYGKATRRNDPFLHFYETFLGAYDRKLRKSRGVYYTPQPVVDFIVRAVDEILRDEFKLENGIAAAGKAANGMHKVQILDPATGTGTFLAAIIRHIHDEYFQGQQGAWQNYATADLLPRLNGFEILMAPYAMAHIKLDMVLRETGCQLGGERARVFLTNALEEHHPDTGTLFSQWLANEADEANRIKRDVPVMVVTGNPPYAGESANKGEWIANLLDAYKKEPGGKEKLKERNSKPLNDDYVKFVRCGQHHIDNKGEGILAYICNNSFLDNQTFRGMRWNLLKSFDKIFVVDLH